MKKIKYLLISVIIICFVFIVIPRPDYQEVLIWKNERRNRDKKIKCKDALKKVRYFYYKSINDNHTTPSLSQITLYVEKNNIKDPFTGNYSFTQENIKVIHSDHLYAYSIGPDRIDQCMKIVYDPSNGTVSSGDIFSTIDEIEIW